ncbi:LysR family transcriptional regulator [Neobacillus fumarioli]|uniref:LysR family transcriptional regulator n=1 Tax=Neobacillus fumarioli TaxID=105229 RepID=UPI000833C461|nr:LysR family transcriptional regulator [Neobacillus fumarioli]
MNIEWLQSFSEAARQKSLSKAAKVHNISQPALRKHIKNLEHYLDVVLFHRTPSGIELTEAGERFYAKIIPVLNEMTKICAEIRQYSQTSPIALGSLHSLATYYLPPKIRGIKILGRPITLMIQNTSKELLQSLHEDRLNAVIIDSIYTDESLWNCELFTEPYYAVFPLEHRFRSKKTVDLSELCNEPLIVHQSPCDTREHIIEQMALIGKKPNIVNEVAFGDFIFGVVTAGMGITIVPKLLAKHISHQQLFTLPITNFGRNRTISLATKNSKIGSQLFQLLSQFEIPSKKPT